VFCHPEGIWGHCSLSQYAAQRTKLAAKTANCSWRKMAGAERRIEKILEDYPQFKFVSGKSYFEENKQLFNTIFLF